jgi:prepilin-type N-terminal cleavage/methylation domain-containing protein
MQFNKNFDKKRLIEKKAFTLIELLIVMVVIGIILGISVTGFRLYKANVAVQSTISDFITEFKTTRNTAQNYSVYVDSANGIHWTYYYAIRINEKSFEQLICYDKNAGTQQPNSTVKAAVYEHLRTVGTEISSSSFNCDAVVNQKKTISDTTVVSTCGTLIYETVSANLVATSVPDQYGECTIKFSSNGLVKNMAIKNNSNGEYREI